MVDTYQETPGFTAEIESSSASSIYVKWTVSEEAFLKNDNSGPEVVQGYRVHFQKVASSYVQYSRFLPPSINSYSIDNLVADTFYKVCVVMYRNDTSSPDRHCVDASTSAWHIPVSIGSSIGAVLALSIIVFIVLLSRCPSLIRRKRTSASESSKYDSITSSRYHDDHNDFSDTTTQCPDHDDDVFTEHNEHHPLEMGKNHHHHHYSQHHQPFPDRLCNGNKNQAFVGATGGVGVLPHRHAHQQHQHTKRAHSLNTCMRTNSLERSRLHHSRRGHLLMLHNAHQSIQSEPSVPQVSEHRPLHVSISDLPPAVHTPDLDAPVSSIINQIPPPSALSEPVGGARAKTHLNNIPRTFHISTDDEI